MSTKFRVVQKTNPSFISTFHVEIKDGFFYPWYPTASINGVGVFDTLDEAKAYVDECTSFEREKEVVSTTIHNL